MNKAKKNKKGGSTVGAILTGLIFAMLFTVIIFEGATDVNKQYNEQVTDTRYSNGVSEEVRLEQEAFALNLSDHSTGGNQVPVDISGGEDVEKSMKGTLAKIFTAPKLVTNVLEGTNETEGLGSKIGIDSRVTGALGVVFMLTIALILIRAFIKNPI